MFEFGRELRRLLSGEPLAAPQDGLTGGDATLLELLDLHLLTNEARGADIAAGRIGAKDRPARLLHAAACWREVTRRTGDATALRNSSLQGAYLRLAARSLGLDCGPMSGFDAVKLDAAFWAGTTVRTNFICSLGHGDPGKVFGRSPRLAFDEACRLD